MKSSTLSGRMIQAIVFDFDGVIADTEPLHWRAFLTALEPFGVQFDYPRYLRDYLGYDDRDGFHAICADHGIALGPDQLPEMIEAKAQAFEALVSAGGAALPGVVELIRHASEQIPIAIASGALMRDIEAVLPTLASDEDLKKRFTTIVTADQVKTSKPDPESYALAVQRLGLSPTECLAIEDTPAGLISARDAGLHRLGVTNSNPRELLTDAQVVVDTLEGLTLASLRAWFV